MGSIPGSGRSTGGGHSNPLQHSCLENPMDRGAWRATVHRVAKSWTRLKQLSMHAHTLPPMPNHQIYHYIGLPWGLMVNNSPANTGDVGSTPGSGTSPGEGNGNPFQYFCLGNPVDRGAWQALVHGGHQKIRHDLAAKQWQHAAT